jgi:hypothetical protein
MEKVSMLHSIQAMGRLCWLVLTRYALRVRSKSKMEQFEKLAVFPEKEYILSCRTRDINERL